MGLKFHVRSMLRAVTALIPEFLSAAAITAATVWAPRILCTTQQRAGGVLQQDTHRG